MFKKQYYTLFYSKQKKFFKLFLMNLNFLNRRDNERDGIEEIEESGWEQSGSTDSMFDITTNYHDKENYHIDLNWQDQNANFYCSVSSI